MDKPKNPLKRTALIWVGIIILGIIIVFIPSIFGIDGFNGGFGISFGGIVLTIFGIIGTVIYVRLASKLDQILKKENQLAHWTYSPEEWKAYTEKEYAEDAAGKKGLFIAVAVITLIVGVIFYAIVRDSFVTIFYTVFGIILIVGLSAYLSAVSTYRQNKKYLGEAYISLDGIYLNHQAHIWTGMSSRLENVVYEEENRSQPRIKFEYSSLSRTGRDYFAVRVPVPIGQEETAKNIAQEFSAARFGNTLK
jgi:hypothetical protein